MPTTTREAVATRVDGDLYDVTYPGHADFDSKVPYSYLRGLARRGYRVVVNQGDRKGTGEPASYVVKAE